MDKEKKVGSKENIFKVFAIWRSIPAIFLRDEKVRKAIDLDDPMFEELMKIKNQEAFAKRFHVNYSKLAQWNKHLRFQDPLEASRIWARKLTKNVLTSLYRAAMSNNPKASADRKLFLQVINEWAEKTKHEHDVGHTLFGILASTVEGKKGQEEHVDLNDLEDIDPEIIKNADQGED